MEPQLDLWKKVLSILGYVFVIPYGILEPILKIPSLTVTPDESSYDVHIAAAVFAVVVHALIIFLLFRGVRRRVSFGVALLIAVAGNLLLRAITFFYVVISLQPIDSTWWGVVEGVGKYFAGEIGLVQKLLV